MSSSSSLNIGDSTARIRLFLTNITIKNLLLIVVANLQEARNWDLQNSPVLSASTDTKVPGRQLVDPQSLSFLEFLMFTKRLSWAATGISVLAALAPIGAARAQSRVVLGTVPNATAMLFCIASDGSELSVWTDETRNVVAVSGIRETDTLPAFAQPMIQPSADTKNTVYQTKGVHRVITSGPAYDPEYVLVVGQTRLSCVPNNDD